MEFNHCDIVGKVSNINIQNRLGSRAQLLDLKVSMWRVENYHEKCKQTELCVEVANSPIRSSDNDSTGFWPPGSLHILGADGHI